MSEFTIKSGNEINAGDLVTVKPKDYKAPLPTDIDVGFSVLSNDTIPAGICVKLDESIPDGQIYIVTNGIVTGDVRDHPCLKDGLEHNWFDLNWQYKKCSKCGMSYEKPANKDFKL